MASTQLNTGAHIELVIAKASETRGRGQRSIAVAVPFTRILAAFRGHQFVVDKNHGRSEDCLVMVTAEVVPSLRSGDGVIVLFGNWQNVRTLLTLERGDVKFGRRCCAGGFRAGRSPKWIAPWHLGNDVAVALRERFGELSPGRFARFGGIDVEILVEDLRKCRYK